MIYFVRIVNISLDVKSGDNMDSDKVVTLITKSGDSMSVDYDEAIECNFSYHSPTSTAVARMVDIRATAKNLAYLIKTYCPQSREQSLSFTKLEESVMWANAAIARHDNHAS